MTKTNIILVDDHTLVREGIKSILRSAKNINLLHDFADGSEVLDHLKKLKNEEFPDIILSDITMPKVSGLELTAEVKKNYPSIKVIILSMHNSEEFINKAIEVGTDGYLLKESEKDELIKAVENVAAGRKYFNHEVSNVLIANMLEKTKKPEIAKENKLSEREKEVLKLIVDGLSNKLIAEKLFVSSRTIDAHRYNIMQKLNVKNTAEMVRLVLKNKLLD